MTGNQEFESFLSEYSSGISYTSVLMEPDPVTVFPFLKPKIVHTIRPVASLVPADEAEQAEKAAASAAAGGRAFILIPGRKFDATGTRHGKGAGWYDRFLDLIPKEWLRIGLCYEDQFSIETLLRQPWDEPMDIVCVVSEETKAVEWIETHARSL